MKHFPFNYSGSEPVSCAGPRLQARIYSDDGTRGTHFMENIILLKTTKLFR